MIDHASGGRAGPLGPPTAIGPRRAQRSRPTLEPNFMTRSTESAPPSACRFEVALARVDRALAWLDGFIARWLPPECNPLAQAGAAANVALSIAIVSGVALLAWYSPSLQFAYSSVSAI